MGFERGICFGVRRPGRVASGAERGVYWVLTRGRSSMVERQPSKLNVDGSSPFARFLLTIPCQIYGESLRDACSGLNLKDRR